MNGSTTGCKAAVGADGPNWVRRRHTALTASQSSFPRSGVVGTVKGHDVRAGWRGRTVADTR